MSITIQHVAVHLENLQAEVSFDDRDANGNILRHGRVQLTLSTATRDALLAEATAAVTGGLVAVTPQNLTALFKARDEATADLAAKQAELASIDSPAEDEERAPSGM